jgi:hypothetical protein
MAVRSIIDVVVNTGAFQRFAAMYQRYQQTLPATVQAWQQIGSRLNATQGAMRTLQATSSAAASSWRTIATYTANVASSLKSATDSLLRWTSITSAISGLLGVGSLFGLDRLAAGVGRGRREATGVGTTYGQQEAFNLTYGRFFDQGILNRISAASTDLSKSWILSTQLGVPKDVINRGDSVEIARATLSGLEKFISKTPTNQLTTMANARRITDIFSLEEIRRYAARNPGERGRLDRDYLDTAAGLRRGPQLEEDYQNFDKALRTSAVLINNAFVEGLAPLIPALTAFSKVISDIVLKFLHEVKPEDVGMLGTKIKEFAEYLGSDEFKTKLQLFIDKVEELGGILIKLIEKIGYIVSPGTAPASSIGKAPITLKQSLQKPGGGGFWDYLRGTEVDTGEEIPLPRPRPKVFGSISDPDTNPKIGSGSNNMGENFGNYWNSSVSQFKNQSSQEVTVTVKSPSGASVPRAAAMIGAAP